MIPCLEDHEDELIAIQDHLNREIRAEIGSIASLKDGLIGTGSLRAAIIGQQRRLSDLKDQVLLCLRARSAGWQLFSAFPGEPHLKAARQAAITESIKTFTATDGILLDMEWEMNCKIDTVKSVWSKQETLNSLKLELMAWTDKIIPEFQHVANEIEKQLADGRKMVLEQQQSVVLAIRTESGKVAEAYQLRS